jgi:hypothetical protein
MIQINANAPSCARHACLSIALAISLIGCGGSGGGGGSSSGGPPPDTTAPDTTLAGAPPAQTNVNTASFTFTSTEGGSTFEGRLDGAAFAAVTSPQNLTGLAEGTHTYEVRARDAAGNTDATPASATWTVDSVAPDTIISAGPADNSIVSSASFEFSSSEANGTLEISVDNAAFVAATSPYQAAGLNEGLHSFRVRTRDAAGNTDATPASVTFTMDTTPPTATISFPPPVSYTEAAFLTIRGRTNDMGGVAQVSVNGVAANPIGGDLYSWSAQVPIAVTGANNVVVSVTDRAGTTTSSAASVVVHNRGPSIELMQGLTYDPTGDRLLVVDQGTAQMYAYDADDGLGRVVADLQPLWPLPETPTPGAVVVDAAANRALVVDRTSDKLGSVNLATGAVSVASPSPGASLPTSLSFSSQLALDAANLRVFATSSEHDSVMAINLVTGLRTLVASNSLGTGTALDYPQGIVYDDVSNPGTPRLLVVNGGSSANVISVNIATGNRAVFSGGGTGSGPTMTLPYNLELDAPRNRVLLTEGWDSTVIAIDLATGNRSYVSGPGVGSGESLVVGSGLAVNPTTGRAYVGASGQAIIQIDLATQNRTFLAGTRVGTGPRILDARGTLLENDNALLFIDAIRQSLMRIDLRTGNRSVVSSHETPVGTGPALDLGVGLALDTRAPAPGSRALVLMGAPDGAVISVDLATGNRTQLASLGNSIVVHDAQSLVVDAPNDRAVILNNDGLSSNDDGLYALNLTTGAVTTISNTQGVGSGAGFGNVVDLVLEPAVNPTRALVSQVAQTSAGGTFGPNILSIDLATGVRSEFVAGSGAPGGIALPLPTYLHLDWSNTRLLGLNGYPGNLFQVPLDTRVRGLVSGTTNPGSMGGIGTGFRGFGQGGLDVDAGRGVAYTFAENGALMAIDLASGDRVLVSH